jgi:hypothetical protein
VFFAGSVSRQLCCLCASASAWNMAARDGTTAGSNRHVFCRCFLKETKADVQLAEPDLDAVLVDVSDCRVSSG